MKTALAIACVLIPLDGDSVRMCGETFRLVGFDTAEHHPRAKCPQEAELARQAHERLGQLIQRGRIFGTLRLERTGRKGKYGRTLARLYVDGENVGDVLIREGLARPYRGGHRKAWC